MNIDCQVPNIVNILLNGGIWGKGTQNFSLFPPHPLFFLTSVYISTVTSILMKELERWLAVLAARAENPGSDPSTHMASNNHR